MQKKSTDILAELHPAPPSDAPLLDPETQHWLAGCWVASSESYWQNTCDWNKIIIITTTIKGGKCSHRKSVVSDCLLHSLSLTARCMRGTRVLSVQSGSVGNCNNASLLLPSPLGLVTTVRHPLPLPPSLSPHTLQYCSSVSDRAAGRHCGTVNAYRVLTRLFPPWPGILPAPSSFWSCIPFFFATAFVWKLMESYIWAYLYYAYILNQILCILKWAGLEKASREIKKVSRAMKRNILECDALQMLKRKLQLSSMSKRSDVTFSLTEEFSLFKVPYNSLHLSELQEQLWRVYSKFDDVYGEKLRSNLFCKYICFLSPNTMETDVFCTLGKCFPRFNTSDRMKNSTSTLSNTLGVNWSVGKSLLMVEHQWASSAVLWSRRKLLHAECTVSLKIFSDNGVPLALKW